MHGQMQLLQGLANYQIALEWQLWCFFLERLGGDLPVMYDIMPLYFHFLFQAYLPTLA